MRKGQTIIGLLFLLLASCTGDKEMRALMDRAEVLMDSCPDSAYTILQSVSPPLLKGSGERIRSLYGLLRTMTDAMQGKGVTADSLIRPAYEYYKEQGESDENIRRLGRSAFYLARFEASRDSTKRAEDLYREAIRCSEQVEDWRTCYMAYSWFARIKTWSDTEEAICLLNTAIDIYHKVEDKPANLVSMLLDLSINHIAFEHVDSAFYYANQAYEIACKEHLETQQFTAKRRLAVIYYEIGNYPKALELAKQGMHGLTDQTHDAALFSLADCYLACDSLEQARNTLLQIEQTNVELSYEVNKALCKIAVRQNDIQQINPYFDSLELATVNMFSKIQQTKEDYYNDNIQKELNNERLAYHSQIQRYSFIIIVLVIVILVLVSYRKIQVYIRQLNEKYRLNLLSHETLISELHARIEQFNKQVAQNEQTLNRYQQLLEQKQNELQQLKVQKTNTKEFQAKQRQYEQEISVLKQLYLNEKEKIQKITLESQQTIFKMEQYVISQSDLFKQIVNNQITIHHTDNLYWKHVEHLLDSCSDGFATRIKKRYPKISDELYHLCLLSRMGLNRKQVASFMCLAEVTIKKKHQDCKRTVFDIIDPQLSFNDIISRF